MANEDETQVTDEQVLADPGSYTVEQVLDVFNRATPEQIADAKALEADGKNRAGIAAYAVPTADPEPRFSRERILSRDEGPRIVGHPYHVIVGALADDDGADFTAAEVRAKVDAFRGRTPHEEA